MRVALLSGGTGAAKLAAGFQAELKPGELTVIANTADDDEFFGLRVCPDVDAVLFRLSGIFNEASGFGVAGDTFAARDMMTRLGAPAWFALGDRDLAFHVLRTAMLREGARLTETAQDLARRLGLATTVLPMADDDVRTCFLTDRGWLSLQEYLVRERQEPRLEGVEFRGLDDAEPSPEAEAAVDEADLVVIGPSNPVISIGPILGLLGRHLDRRRTLAVSPIVGGLALKGPTVEMMLALGRQPTALGVAEEYQAFAGWYVLDKVDRESLELVKDLGYRVAVLDTVMEDLVGARRLAAAILEAVAKS